MSAPVPMQQETHEPMSDEIPESQSDSESDGEDFSDAPNVQPYISANNALKEINSVRKEHLETMKRTRDQLQDYMIGKDAKFMRLDGMIVEFKKSKKLSWNEKSLREHVDEDGKLDLDMYKTNQTEVVEKMSIKLG